jgi:hypothetical protein
VTRTTKRPLSFLVGDADPHDPRSRRRMVIHAVRGSVDARARRERRWLLACVERAAFLDGGGVLHKTPMRFVARANTNGSIDPRVIRPGSDEDFADRGGTVLAAIPPGQPPNPKWVRIQRARHHTPGRAVAEYLRNQAEDPRDRMPTRMAPLSMPLFDGLMGERPMPPSFSEASL